MGGATLSNDVLVRSCMTSYKGITSYAWARVGSGPTFVKGVLLLRACFRAAHIPNIILTFDS